MVQIEPTSAIAPSAELVLWSRLGSAFDPQELWDALDEQRLIELHQTLRVPEDIALFRAEMAEWPGSGELREWQEDLRDWVRANNDCRRDILERLRADGPLPISELPDTCVVPWNVQRLERQPEPPDDARQARAARRGRGRRRARAATGSGTSPPGSIPTTRCPRRTRRAGCSTSAASAPSASPGPAPPSCPLEPVDVGEAGEPAVVEGVRGQWRVDPAQLGQPFAGRAALLSPFDRLLADRKRLTELFEFDYILEMYKPAAQRRWGYYALPILYGDRLVGKLDARADPKEGELRVAAVHRDVPFSKAMTAAVDREIKDLARWLELELVLPD